ncbi:MAG: Ferric reductase like transrane component [Ilumatobacteraceae bacterium]|nr:Ferric reductase like transrane component [Ilumatobacteraceae bacterium]
MSNFVAALTRSSGIVAGILVAVTLVTGSLFSARETGRRIRPAWWLDLHNGLGGLTLVAVAVHVAASVFDADFGVGVLDVLIPGVASTSRGPLAWGVLATYAIAGAVLTTWPRRLRRPRLWRTIHVSSVAGVVLALIHGYQMGTDAPSAAFKIGLVAIAATASYALGVRAFDVLVRRRSTASGGSQPAPR